MLAVADDSGEGGVEEKGDWEEGTVRGSGGEYEWRV